MFIFCAILEISLFPKDLGSLNPFKAIQENSLGVIIAITRGRWVLKHQEIPEKDLDIQRSQRF